MNQQAAEAVRTETRCSQCGAALEECACCNEPDCGVAICYGCLNVAVGQAVPPTHTSED